MIVWEIGCLYTSKGGSNRIESSYLRSRRGVKKLYRIRLHCQLLPTKKNPDGSGPLYDKAELSAGQVIREPSYPRPAAEVEEIYTRKSPGHDLNIRLAVCQAIRGPRRKLRVNIQFCSFFSSLQSLQQALLNGFYVDGSACDGL